MKLLVIQLSLPSRHSIPLWSKYSPQHHVLKHTQFMCLLPSIWMNSPEYLLLSLHIATKIVHLRRLLVTANVVPSLPILVTLMMETLSSSESSILTRVTRRNFPEDVILESELSLRNVAYVTDSTPHNHKVQINCSVACDFTQGLVSPEVQ
jgi:hypothetical protein